MADHLGARKNASFKAVCTAPSINKTPVGSATPPLPYPVNQDLSSSVGTTATVRFNDDPAYVLNGSTQPSCIGDAAGSVGGVKSGTVGGEVKPVQGSTTVRLERKPVIRDADPCTLNKGNCPGIYVAQGGASPPTASANPPVKPETPNEGGWWSAASPWVHGALGVASFVPGLSIITGGADAAIYAAEGDLVEAGLSAASMIPGGKVATTAGKLAKGAVGLAKGAHVAEDAAKAARLAKEAEEAAKAAKLAREAEEANKLRKAEQEAAEAAKAKDGAKVKPKPKPKCGQSGPYKDRKSHDNEGMNWDHVPSQKALLERALRENRGRPLTQRQIDAIVENAPTIAIPKDLHQKLSETFGGRQHQTIEGLRRPSRDSQDLQRATQENTNAILDGIDKHDPGCKGAYKTAAVGLTKRTDAEWAAWLKQIMRDSK